MSDAEGFFTRWSRRKAARRVGDAPPRAVQDETPARDTKHAPAAREGATPSAARAEPPASRSSTTPRQPPTASVARGDALPLPTLADVEGLVPTSDFSRFVAPGVDASVQHAALKKLFADPHFNLMDGLDTYIEDFGRPDPLPEGMLQQMAQARFLGLFTEPEAADECDALPHTTPQAPDAPMVTDPDPNDEDPDLRLQPDDAAGPAGPEASPVGHPGREHGRA